MEMDMLRKRLAEVKQHDPTHQIIIVWDICEVKGLRPHLTDDQANQVLEQAKDDYDPASGITLKTLETIADELFPRT